MNDLAKLANLAEVLGAMIVWSGMFFPFVVSHGAVGFGLLGWLAYRSAPFFTGKRLIGMEAG